MKQAISSERIIEILMSELAEDKKLIKLTKEEKFKNKIINELIDKFLKEIL